VAWPLTALVAGEGDAAVRCRLTLRQKAAERSTTLDAALAAYIAISNCSPRRGWRWRRVKPVHGTRTRLLQLRARVLRRVDRGV
jgi:hypothetical protein